jgi:OOP family OmpA-OmpF porin
MANPKRHRAPILSSLIALIAAGGLAWLGASKAAEFIEHRNQAEVTRALQQGGFGWAGAATDGLLVRLTGTAPDEIQRFRAKSAVDAVVEPGRVIDDMQVAASRALAQPQFAIQLLRNDDGISIVGLVPASLDRAAMVAALRRRAGTATVTDLVEAADYPVPPGWDAAFVYGMKAAEMARRGKVSVTPGKVAVRAITDNANERHDLEQMLRRAKPADVALELDVTAPRPVVTPFTLRFVKDMAGARFDACAADNAADRDRILQAGIQAGIPGEPQCLLALGVPSPVWADAAVAGVRAVATLGAGAVTLSDTEMALFAPASVDDAAFDEAVGRLEAGLPPGFTLSSDHEVKVVAPQGPAEFSASLNGGGVMLRGRIGDDRMRQTVESLARAHFGAVDSALRADASAPEGWTLRAIAALEVLEGLDHGAVTVTPGLIKVSGVSGSKTATDLAAARLAQRLGAGARYELAIRYDRRLDPILGLPSGMECVDALNATMRESEIGFEPSKALIAGDPKPVLERLAETMQDCGDYRIEVGGHTDSQGSEAVNAELSRGRAQAVLEAMTKAGIDTSNMTVKGYGAAVPVADNDTDAGREANRRIEFTLLSEIPVLAEAPKPAVKVTGVTDSAEVATQRVEQAAVAAATGAIRPVLAPVAVSPGLAPAHAGAIASAPAAIVVHPAVATAIIDALTVPAVEAAFPDPEAGTDAGIPLEALPPLNPLAPPEFPQAAKP